ncbi:hypothetical protein L207DRAFT_566806 [Hyaloscypha variabilis F]|uniref:Uncharacterized protein n=1 Tax=Hyaloscypha variabilis (strain UAMH 11265 / GT02V1 / F) TaxID=1149755 RepID=A0A2J6RN31_HYAVF|nr:hypothetical protein L207DRAFT_566806 [Hyaloscypha variabilis F]
MFSASTVGLAALLFAYVSQAQTFNCDLEVPPNPLTAEGLATPYKVSGCNQIDFSNQGSFVEAAILDPATGDITIYNPLVINNGMEEGTGFIAPVVPTLPANAVVGIWFGSNALTLTLTGTTQGCVNGDGNSIFGQFAYCNAPAFFSAAQTAIAAGLLTIPPVGTASIATGQACPSTRDFRVVDMDQSDNVDSTYLLINGKVLAQNTAANAAANKNSTVISNGSDNLLINEFIAPTMGCTPFTKPCITSPTGSSPAMALNELQANAFPPAGGPALVPLNDDFAVIDGNAAPTQSLVKTNLYRAGVGQPQAADAANASGTTYCQQYAQSALFIASNEALFSKATSPAPAVANNLFTFLANRFATSFGPVPSLGCATIFNVNVTDLIKQTTVDCIVTAATIDTTPFQQIFDGQIKPGGTSVASSAIATATTAATATGKATKATGATQATTTAANASGTGTSKSHKHFRGLRNRNLWAQVS